MKKIWTVLLVLFCLTWVTACGSSGNVPAGDGESASDSIPAESQTEEDRETDDSFSMEEDSLQEIEGLNVALPDDQWRGEYSDFYQSWNLYKEGCYDSLNPTMQIFPENLKAEEALLASQSMSSSMSESVYTDYDYEVDGVTCPAYEQYTEQYDKNVLKIFYPLDSGRSLRINLYVSKGGQEWIDPESDEIKGIIQSLVTENAFTREEPEAVPESLEISGDDLSLQGEKYMTAHYTVLIPEGWQAFASSYGSTYIIKGGTDKKEYGEKPTISVRYNDSGSAYNAYLESRSLYTDSVELETTINNIPCYALKFTDQLESGAKYWTHYKFYLQVGPEENISMELILESSEFDDVGIQDDEVRQMIISIVDSSNAY